MIDGVVLQASLDAVVVVQTGASYCAGAGVSDGPRAYLVTAYHCVADGGRPLLRWRDGREARGRVVARSPGDDLALIEVEGEPFPTLEVREGPALQGEEAWGLGHPFGLLAGGKLAGLLEWSVSHGVVSASGGHLIQTDAALNPGNSGGPLVDGEGRLIGVVSRKLRADNLAFVSTAGNVLALMGRVEPEGVVGPAVGGSYGVGLSLMAEQSVWGGGQVWLGVRDRLVVTAALGLAPEEDWAAHASLDVTVRQRFGRGSLTAVLEAGPQIHWSGAADADGAWVGGVIDPGVGARVGFNQVSLGGWLRLDGGVAVTVGLGWPGKIGVF